MKIGVFVCHCGSNIEATVDTATVAKIALTYPDVVFSEDTMYTCSEPGQENIVQAIKTHGLDGVVVASCSPRMHEPTFRRTVERAGLNRYMFEMANIREHVSWIGRDREANTNKAAELVRLAVEKLRRNTPLYAKQFDVTKRVLVIGGGVAGIQAALDAADSGIGVVIGGARKHHRRQDGQARQDLPHHRLLKLRARAQDGGRGPESEHHALRPFRGGAHFRLRGQLHREDQKARHLR